MSPNVLSVRSPIEGEVMGEEVCVDCAPGAEAATLHVILIHGYNNAPGVARSRFDHFRRNLRPLSPRRDLAQFGEMWEFHWPGDRPGSDRSLRARLVSAALFPARIGDARESGRLLGEYLAGWTHRPTVHIVAHSLGCRVALHALHTIDAKGTDYAGARIGHVFLLAAAVPAAFCEPGRRYPKALDGSTEHVFFSRSDDALRAFPKAQSLYGEQGGAAVGLEGFPARRWNTIADTNLEHGQYWGSRAVAETVVARLVSGDRFLSDRPLPETTRPSWTRRIRSLPRRPPPLRLGNC